MCKFHVGFDKRTDRYKTRHVVITYLNVTFEDRFSNAPTLAKIEFGQSSTLPSIPRQQMSNLARSCGLRGEAVGTGGLLGEDGELQHQHWTGRLTYGLETQKEKTKMR